MKRILIATIVILLFVVKIFAQNSCSADSWTATSLTGAPASRWIHTAVWSGTEMIVWGGRTANGMVNDGGRYNPATNSWTATSLINAPVARERHISVWTGSEMIIWGGDSAGNGFCPITGGKYNPLTNTWTAMSLANVPSGRNTTWAVWTGTEMVVWGGGSLGVFHNDGGRYNPTTNTWAATSMVNVPIGRWGHTVVWTGTEVIIWGGIGVQGVSYNTGGRYNPVTNSWIATSLVNAPSAREYHQAVWSGSVMVVWGGQSLLIANGIYNNGGRYDPITDTWTSTTMVNAPASRYLFRGVWSPTCGEMIVFGGSIGNNISINTGGRYNPITDTWTATTLTNAAASRFWHTAVWAGTEMIVWGGFSNNLINSGGRYMACCVNVVPNSALATPANICNGQTTTLGFIGGGLETGGSWHWYTGSCGGNAVSTQINPAFTLTSTTTYWVRAEGPTNTTGCVSVTVTVSTQVATITASTNVSCNGGSNGSATVTLTGGTGTPTYIWSDGQTTQTATGLAAGTYTVTVNNNTGQCTPSGIELVTNGDFTSGNTGFNSGYNYLSTANTGEGQYNVGTSTVATTWNSAFISSGDHTSGTGNFMIVNGSGTPNTNVWCQTIPVSPNTTYNFSTWVSNLYISSPAQLQFSINGTTIGTVFNAPASNNIWVQFFATWNSGSNTTATICILNQNTATGGNDFGIDDISFQQCIFPCPTNATVTITQPTALSTSISPNDSICFGAATTQSITATGGTPAYTYLWSPGALTTNTISIAPTTFTTYTVTVTDSKSCTSVKSTNVFVYPSPTPTATNNSPLCTGDTLRLSASEGIGYIWNGPANFLSAQQSPVINNATPNRTGTYTVTVSDNHLCTATTTTIVTVNPLPVPVITNNNPVCLGDTIKVNVSGTTSTFTWTGPNGFSSTNQNILIPNASQIEAGNYAVTVTDANGCSASTSINVIVTPINPSIGNNTPICENSLLNIYVTGGVSYLWNGPNGYVSTQSNIIESHPTSLYTGNYNVTITDSYGCTVTMSTPVVVNPLPIPVATNNTPICVGNQLDLTCSGGATYLWSGPASFSSTEQNPFITPAQVYNNGTYYVTVTDTNGCKASTNTVVIVNPRPVINISNNSPVCSGDIVMISSSGGTGYLWSCPNNGFTAFTQSPAINGAVVADSGYYTVTVTLNGCTSTATTHVIVYPLPVSTAISNSPVCYGDSLVLTATGGAYYNWSSINGFTSTSPNPLINNATDAASGVYTVTVTDYNGCSSTASTTAFVANKLTVTTIDKQICDGSTLTISAYAVGGTPPYTYYWNGALSSAQLTIAPTTNTQFTAQVIDANSCISNVSVMTITILPKIKIKAFANKDTVCPGEAALITITPTQGQPPFHYFLQDGTVINSPYLAYTDSVHDFIIMASDGCGSVHSDTIKINVYPVPPANFNPAIREGCEPLEVFFDETSVINGQTYTWDFGDLNSLNTSNQQHTSHIYESSGNYDIRLTVISKDGCKTIYTYPRIINVYPLPDAKFVSDKEDDDILTPLISFTNLTNIPNCRYYWNFGDGDSSSIISPSHLYKRMGTYIVELVAITSEGCRDTATKSIKITDIYTFYAPTAFSPTYDNKNDIFFVWGNGIDSNKFNLIVYDRWGEPIFETKKYDQKDPKKYGWDGMVKGMKLAEVGVYSWVCIYRDMRNIEHKQAGLVTVVR